MKPNTISQLTIELLTHPIDSVTPIQFKGRNPLMLNKIWKILFSGLLAICLVMGLSMQDSAIGQPGLTRYIITPDYVSGKITIWQISPRPHPYSLLTPDCNPNSVVQHNLKLYVACNQDFGKSDFIGIYDFVDLSGLRPINSTVPFEKTINSPEFNSIVAMQFDDESNLWVSSYNNDQIIRFPKASLATSNPKPDKKLVHSPDKPAGITFDGQHGSLWVVGQYDNGIVLNIPKAELNKPGTTVAGITTIDANPSYCISNSAPGCQQQPGLFDNPEGIAILNNDIWVSNNGGDHPAASLVRLRPTQGLSDRFGNGIATPFSCPGGLDSDFQGLWINDQSFSLTDTTCGATDATSETGKVLFYNSSDLANPVTLPPTPRGIKNITSRPGFGGISAFSSSVSFN
jgi:hypothetical protein